MKSDNSNLNYPYIVTTNGFSYSSLQQIGEVLPSRSFGAAKIQPYADLAKGCLLLRSPMVSLVERNFPVELSYIYDSSTRAWHFAHRRFKKMPAKPDDQTSAILVESDGREVTYTYDPKNNFWWPPALNKNTPYLSYDYTQSIWILFDSNTQIKEYYTQAGNLLRREDAAGRVTSYEYHDPNDSNRLTAIIGPSDTRYELYKEAIPDGSGYVISYRAKTKDGNVKKLQTEYFNNNNQLTKTVIPLDNINQTYEVNYQYYAQGYLVGVKQTDGTQLDFMYDLSNRIELIKSDFTQTAFNYSQDPKNHLPVVTLKGGQDTNSKFYLDDKNRISKIGYPRGFPLDGEIQTWDEIAYSYDNDGRIKTIIHPNHNLEEFAYSGKEGLLTSHINNGQKTEYYYDRGHSQHLCTCVVRYLNDQPVVTRKVYDYSNDKAFLRFEISSEGRVIEYRPDPWGNLGSKRIYINNYYDLSRFQPDRAPILSYMLDWVKGKEAQVSLTEYIYDPERHAKVLFTRQYGHVDAQGNGIDDALMSNDLTNYDIFGNLLGLVHTQSKGSDPAYTDQNFDGLQRLISQKNPLDEKTQYTYLDAQKKISVIQPNQRIEEQSYDERGFVEQSKQTVTIEKQTQSRIDKYYRDAMGRLIRSELPDGRNVVTFYDQQFRLGYKVNPGGAVTEYRYNVEKRFNTAVSYANHIDINKLVNSNIYKLPQVWNLTDLIQPDLQNDRYTYEFFDGLGQLRYTVDAENYIVEMQYDTLNRLTAKIAYQQPITDQVLSSLKNGQAIHLDFDPSKDRCNRSFYDSDGFVVGEQDAAGYFTEYKRNAAGWVTEKIIYAHPRPINLNLQEFNLNLPRSAPENDAHTYYFYNHRGLCEIEVDAEGYVTEKTYLAGGLLDKQRRYLNKVDPNWLKNPITRPPLPKLDAEDRTTINEYDLLDRPLKQKSNLGEQANVADQVVLNAYDVRGDKVLNRTQDAQQDNYAAINGDTLHGLEKQYDAWEQVAKEANAYVALELAKIDANTNLNPDQKKAEKAKVWQTLSTQHIYDEFGLKLKTAIKLDTTNNAYKFTLYYYDQNRRPVIIIDPTGGITEKTYNTFGEAIAIRQFVNRVPVEKLKSLTGGYLNANQTTVSLIFSLRSETDAITWVKTNRRGLVTDIIDPEKFKTTKKYNAFKECIEENLPVEEKDPSLTITHRFEARGLEIQTTKKSGDLMSHVTWRFDNPYGKETEWVDENDGIYKNAYDALGRIKQAVNPEQVITHQYSHDAFDRVTTETNSFNQVFKHDYNQAARTQTITTLDTGVATTVTTNIFGETIKVTDGLNNTESFQHTPDGQVAVHTDALQNQTQDKYNLQDWHTAHTDANQVETVFTQNDVGQLLEQIEDSQGLKLKTRYERDGLGNAISITNARQIKTQQAFDCRSKLITTKKEVSGRDIISVMAYNGQGDKILQQRGDEREPNQSVTTLQRDGLNRAIGSTIDPAGLHIQTQQHLDEAGHVISNIDPNGNVIRSFYNSLGKKCFTVTPFAAQKATLQEWQYDTEGRVRCERTYVNGIDPSALTDRTPIKTIIDQAKNLVDSFDTLTWYFYDADSKERFKVKVLAAKESQHIVLKGLVTEKRFNKAAHEILIYQYENTIDASQIANLTTEQLAQLMATKVEPAGDRITYKILDNNYQECFVIDAKGAITEQQFDKKGKVIIKTSYATLLNAQEAAQLAQLSFTAAKTWLIQNQKIDVMRDRTTVFIFDTVNQPEFTIDAEGGVIRFKHDANGNLIEECHFKTPLNPIPQNYEELVVRVRNDYSHAPDGNADRVTQHEYDNADNVIKTIDANNNTDSFERDALGNIRKHTDRSNNSWQYTTDKAERVIDEITPATDITIIEKNTDDKLVPKHLTAQTIIKHTDYDNAGNKIAITEAANLAPEQQRKINFAFTENNQFQAAKIKDVPIGASADVATSLKNRPEVKQDIEIIAVYNNKRLKVAEQNEAKQWSFTVYDSTNKPLYKIDAYGGVSKTENNVFGEAIKEIRFANKLTIDLNPYTATGIPQAVVENNLTINAKEDRTTDYLRDKQGNVEVIKQGPVFYYLPGNPPTFGFAKTETKNIYNAFKETIYSAQLISADPNNKRWAEEFTWVNRLGKKLAECNPNKYVKRYTINTFGEVEKMVEWANQLTITVSPQTKLSQLDAAYQPAANDRMTTYVYDQLGQKIKETKVGVVTQVLKFKEENNKQIPYLENLPAQDLSCIYQYSPTQQLIAKTNEERNTEYYYYDARGFKVGETGLPFDNNGQTEKLIPLTYYYVNPHGQTTAATSFKTGTANSDGKHLPAPIALDPEHDQTQLKLFDVRGLMATQQDSLGNQKNYVYTPTRKVAREFWQLTNWLQDSQDKMKFTTVTHLDEKRYSYDNVDRPAALKIYRDNNFVEGTWSNYNTFGDAVSEGSQEDPSTHELYRKFDMLGNLWSSNASQGANTITVRDLIGRETLQLQSPTQDLAKTAYENIPNLLMLGISEIERTETEHDLLGNTLKKSLPAAHIDDPNQPENIPLNMLVSHPAANTTTISWTVPQESNVEAEFWLYPKDNSSAKQTLNITVLNGRCSVDVSNFTTDTYTYLINYFFVDPVNNQHNKLLYITKGTVIPPINKRGYK